MKNLFKYSLVLLSVALGFVACNDDDDDYKPGVPTSTQQVFFSNAQKKSVEIHLTLRGLRSLSCVMMRVLSSMFH